MTITYVRSTFVEDQREFVEHFPYGKQIGKMLDIKTSKNVPRPQNRFSWVCNLKNQIPDLYFFEKYMKFAHKNSGQNGSDAFPNELMRFRIEANTISDKIQKHCKNAVII